MLIISNKVKVKKLSRLLFRTVLPFSVIVLFGFFFSRGASVAETASPYLTDSDTALVLPHTAYTSAHAPLHLPFESKLKIEESEETEDTKPKDSSKTVAKKYVEHQRYQTAESEAADKNRLAHLRKSFYNRATVSLVTLHHTWKIFLI